MTAPTARELHQEHAYERALQRRVQKIQDHEAEVRRLTEERWQRRILPLLASVNEVESDFPGCIG